MTCLGACSAFHPQIADVTLTPAGQQERLQALQCWQIKAKIGVRTYDQAESARVDWIQQADEYRLTISGPLGIGAVRIDGNENRVVMQTERNRMLVARNPETLIRQELGWELPVSNLYYWVRGLPAPDSEVFAEQRAGDGSLLHLEQSGWLLDYQRYVVEAGLSLPEKITLTHPELQVRLIIKDWQALDCPS